MKTLKLTALALIVRFIGVATAPAVGDATTVYYGSSKSYIYHLPSCPWAQKISSENLIIFKSKPDSAAKGYRPCKVCKP